MNPNGTTYPTNPTDTTNPPAMGSGSGSGSNPYPSGGTPPSP
jgi:hypothetical protein